MSTREELQTVAMMIIRDTVSVAKAAYPDARDQGRIARAEALILAGKVRRHEDGAWTVKSEYQQGVEYPSPCTCADRKWYGINRCKHSFAVCIQNKAEIALGSAHWATWTTQDIEVVVWKRHTGQLMMGVLNSEEDLVELNNFTGIDLGKSLIE